MHRGQGALVALLFAAACAPFAPRSTAPLIASSELIETKRASAVAAYERLQRALDARDSIAIAVNLHPEVIVISPTNDTLYGASAWRFLVFLVGDSTRRVTLGRGKFEPCLEGDVYQYNGDFSPRGTPIQVTGRFGILWATDERPVVARQIVLSYYRTSLRKRLPCQFEFHVASAQHRLTGTIGPSIDVLGTTSSARGVRTAMRASGITYVPPTVPNATISGPGSNPFPQVPAVHAGLTAVVRYRSERTLSRELQIDVGLPETVKGFDMATSRYVEAKSFQGALTFLLQKQRRPFRFGLGPSVRLARWTVHEDQRTLGFIDEFLQGPRPADTIHIVHTFWVRAPGAPESNVASWSPSYGIAFEVARLIPITRRMGGEIVLRGGVGTNSNVPGTPGFPAASVASRFLTLGASIGEGWR